MNRDTPFGKQARLGSFVLGSVALNFASAHGVKGVPPPFGKSLGSNFSTSQTPEISGAAPGFAASCASAARESASVAATVIAERIKRFRKRAPLVLILSGLVGSKLARLWPLSQ